METPRKAIVLVERDKVTLELYQRELSREFQVFAFHDTAGVMDVLRTQTIDAVILEPDLPSGAGWALLSEINQFQFLKPLPIILCSTLDARRRGFENGANIYLVKPVLPTVLIETLHQLTYHLPDKKKEA